jgi:hypothetical protein
LHDENPPDLDWDEYESPDYALDQITVEGPDGDCAEWLSPDETLAQAASNCLIIRNGIGAIWRMSSQHGYVGVGRKP